MGETDPRVAKALAWLERRGSKRNREGMARYGIVAPKVFGVSVASVRQLAKQFGRDHALASELWDTGWYEARMLCAFVGEPGELTPRRMDRWARDFDNWAICDTVCFHLFDRSPHAWGRVRAWSRRRAEFEKRAAFALLAGLALHARPAADERFLALLPVAERAASDERNFVKKGVSWALRSVGQRRPALHEAVVACGQRLAASADPSERWVGRDVLRDLRRPLVRKRLARRPAS